MTKVLLVEDNDMNRDLFVRYLELHGFAVVTANNGIQALDMAASDRPDLILMDMSLPLMDGWEATRRLKANLVTSTIPVLALTAHAMAEDRRRSFEAGCMIMRPNQYRSRVCWRRSIV
ncbi:MAG: response regulator [Roseiflexaceae bacterium]|nr:response regulator [Roseiflexaceae bacterium]